MRYGSVALVLGILAAALLFLAIKHDYSIQASATWISGPNPRNAGSISLDYLDYDEESSAGDDDNGLGDDQGSRGELGGPEVEIPVLSGVSSGGIAATGGDAVEEVEIASSSGNGTVRAAAACDLYDGRWVRDGSGMYPLFQPFDCPFVDTAFRCQENGRKDKGYLQWRWQPYGCYIPRFDALDMLKRLRNKKLVFAGDSIARNQWESLVCMLYSRVSNRSNVFEARKQQVGKTRPSYSIRFPDYKTQIDFYRSHFLIPENRRPRGIPERRKIKCSLQLDRMDKSASKWRAADILVFNSGHWWNHGKISKGRCFFLDGPNYTTTMDVRAAYARAMQSWASWVDNHTGKKVFFRGFAPSHFSGGDWDSGGTCESHVQPLGDESKLDKTDYKVKAVEKVLETMKSRVVYLNITKLTSFRKDGHVAGWGKINGSGRQDCSHWCLPGVPDTWNELLYASLLDS